MKTEETSLKGCYCITPSIHEDERGVFLETFNRDRYSEILGKDARFVQDNQSVSRRGVMRGLHYQDGEHSQAKLVNVVKGKVLDVCVDLRRDSSTFGKHFSIILSSENHKQVYIPRGFAHGFLTLSDWAIFTYKCDNYYHKASERGIIYNDPILDIDWSIPEKDMILSNKDRKLPSFNSFLNET